MVTLYGSVVLDSAHRRNKIPAAISGDTSRFLMFRSLNLAANECFTNHFFSLFLKFLKLY